MSSLVHLSKVNILINIVTMGIYPNGKSNIFKNTSSFKIIKIMKSNLVFMFYIVAVVVGLDHPMTILADRDVGPYYNQDCE